MAAKKKSKSKDVPVSGRCSCALVEPKHSQPFNNVSVQLGLGLGSLQVAGRLLPNHTVLIHYSHTRSGQQLSRLAGGLVAGEHLRASVQHGSRQLLRDSRATHEAGGQAGGQRHWRPFRQRYRKRNSVNPPLIRYNGSLVVCPVLRSLGHKFACAARVRTTVPNNRRITKHTNKQTNKKPAAKSQVANLHIAWCEGRDVCQQQGHAHTTWPSV